LFPLGRALNGKTNEFYYFVQPASCGDKSQTQTVRQWLAGFGALEDEAFANIWLTKTFDIALTLNKIYEVHKDGHAAIIGALFIVLYLSYDMSVNFMPQFEKNIEAAANILHETAEGFGIPDGKGGVV
jgi:hypothetical protein